MTRSGLKMVLEHFSRRTKSQIKEIEQKLDEAIAQTSEQFHTAVNAANVLVSLVLPVDQLDH